MNLEILDLNDRAEAHLKNQEWGAALALFQKVFLDFSRADDVGIRAQVARALWGAMQCSSALGDAKRAEQIQATLERRYGADSNSRVRYYLEMARGNTPAADPDEAAEKSGPDQCADPSLDNWDDFLSANGLELEEPALNPARNVAPPGAPQNTVAIPMISENEVALSSLKSLFDAAFIENAFEGDDLLRVVPDGAMHVLVAISESHKLVHFSALYGLKKFAREEDKRKLVNRLNDGIIFVRFAVNDETRLIADYYLPFSGGLLPQQVIHTVRLMARITSASIEKLDEDDCLA